MKRHPAKPLPRNWFFKTSGYRVFMVRELTSVFLGGYLVFLIVLLRRAGDGAEPFAALLETMRSPLSVALHLLVLAAALFHSITWFNITPRIAPARIGEERLPNWVMLVGAGFLPWAAVSAVVAWLLLK